MSGLGQVCCFCYAHILSLLIFFPISYYEKWLKIPVMTVNLSISHISSVIFSFMYFEAIVRAYKFRIIIFLMSLNSYYYDLLLSLPFISSGDKVYFS